MRWFLHLKLMLLIICGVGSQCPDHCVCDVPDIECNNCLPSFIPENITRVIANQVPLKFGMNFTTPGWQTVTDLSLTLGKTVKMREMNLQDYEFRGLVNLEHLKVMCNCFLKIKDKAFHGLTNVTVLDLSNNTYDYYHSYYHTVSAFEGETVLPNISELYLSNITDLVSTQLKYLNLDHLHNAMMNKPLKILDLSVNNISFDIINFAQVPSAILPQLQTFNISNTGEAIFSLPNIYKYYNHTPEAVFTNLQVLDASYPTNSLKGANTYFLPYNLKELYVKSIFKSDFQLRGTYNSTGLCITTIFFSQNRTICIRSRFNKLQKLDISESSLTYIQPDLVHPFQALSNLDISRNKLGPALADENYAKSFFKALQNLQVLIISDNNITIIPNNALRHNSNLRTLDISYNRLVSVDFGINYLVLLEYLDLSFNNIVSIDSTNCKILKNLHFSLNSSHSSKLPNELPGFRIEGNPLSCSCDNLCLLKFIVEHDVNKTNTCSMKDTTEVMKFASVKQLEYSCEAWIATTVYSTLAVITIILSSIAAVFVVKERRRLKFKRLKEAGIEKYGKTRKKYVAFLSFSGDDEEFVMTQVYPKLESDLKQMLNTESDCVATGGTHFRPGHSIKDEIMRCIEESSVVIFFLSDNFINKPWCREEVHKAFCSEKPIVLMVWGKLKKDEMPTALRKHYETFTRVHWLVERGEYVMRPNWEQFCETIIGLMGQTDQQKTHTRQKSIE